MTPCGVTRGSPPKAGADHLLEQLTQWCGKTSLELDDDLTVLVLDIPGPQSASTTEAG